MAKETNNQQRLHPPQQQQIPQMPPRQERSRFVFETSWLWAVISLLGMWYLLTHISPVLKWDGIMDILQVHSRQRYTSIGILCLIIIFIVAAVRIIGRKDE